MTVSKTTATREMARPVVKYCSTCAKCGGETYWHGDTWYHESGRDVMKCGVAEPQTPPDSLTAELQKENARLDKALREAMMLCGIVRLTFWQTLGKEMREQVEKVEELGFTALGISAAALSKEKAK